MTIPCRICGGTAYSRGINVRGVSWAKCQDCSSLFAEPIPSAERASTNALEAYYDEVYEQLPEKFFIGLRQISRFTPAGSRLLDVGCGGGHFLKLAQDKGFEASGLEDNPAFKDIYEREGLTVHIGSLRKLPEHHFDVVTAFDVAEHVPGIAEFIRDIRRVLRPGGILYLESPRRSVMDLYLAVLTKLRITRYAPITPDHVQQFSDLGLQTLLVRCGFEIVDYRRRQGLSWCRHRRYLESQLGITNPISKTVGEVVAEVALGLRLLGRNKASVVAMTKRY